MTVQMDDYIATRAEVRTYLEKALQDANDASGRELDLYDDVKQKLIGSGARLIAHYYVHPDIQRLAEETGGIVADSLEMARFGAVDAATTLIVAGVSFMGETAKILSPEKRILCRHSRRPVVWILVVLMTNLASSVTNILIDRCSV